MKKKTIKEKPFKLGKKVYCVSARTKGTLWSISRCKTLKMAEADILDILTKGKEHKYYLEGANYFIEILYADKNGNIKITL